MMKVSNKGLYALAVHEGIVWNPYNDSKSIRTFGIGHTSSAGEPIPRNLPRLPTSKRDERIKFAMDVFKKDIEKFEKRVNNAVKVPLQQHQFDALVSFDFNTGGINVANLTKSLNSGDYHKAGLEFMGWKKPISIINRRLKEKELFMEGVYPNEDVPLYNTKPGSYNVDWGNVEKITYDQFMSLIYGYDKPVEKPKQPVEDKDKKAISIIQEIMKLLQSLLEMFTKK